MNQRRRKKIISGTSLNSVHVDKDGHDLLNRTYYDVIIVKGAGERKKF